MVVDDLDVLGIAVLPGEANAELLVHPDAVLSFTIARERFELVPGRDAKIAEVFSGVEYEKFPEASLSEVYKLAAPRTLEHLLGLLAPEVEDHTRKILRTA